MLINYDAKQLEWRAVAHLSNDKIAIEEINNDLDFHSDNQKKFKLPSRLIAKKFLFRTIYCPHSIADRTAYAFSVDNDFKDVGGIRFWRAAVDSFYEKYTGIYNYHIKLMQQVSLTGRLHSETGRDYVFEQVMRKGEMEWPVSDIANFPVQGFSADLMCMARVTAYNRLHNLPYVKFINTVHDSLVLNVDKDLKTCYNISITVKKAFRDLPINFERIYGKKLLVKMDCDSKVGINWLWMHELNIKEKDLV